MKKGDFRIFQGYIVRYDGSGRQGKDILAILFSSGNIVPGYYYGCGEPLTLKFVLNNEYVSLCKDKSFLKELLTYLTRPNLT